VSDAFCSALRCCSGNQAGLWLLPFQTLRLFSADHGKKQLQAARVSRQSRLGSGGGQPLHARRQMSRSGSGYGLLRQYSHQAHIRIGVARSQKGQLQAHAWVESQGRIVSGGLKICGAIPTSASGGKIQ